MSVGIIIQSQKKDELVRDRKVEVRGEEKEKVEEYKQPEEVLGAKDHVPQKTKVNHSKQSYQSILLN